MSEIKRHMPEFKSDWTCLAKRNKEQSMFEEQAIELQRDLGREALGLMVGLVSTLDCLASHMGPQTHQNVGYLAADAQQLAQEIKALLECFDGDPVARVRDLMVWSRRDEVEYLNEFSEMSETKKINSTPLQTTSTHADTV